MHLSPTLALSTALFLIATSSKQHTGSVAVVDAQVSVPGRFHANYAGSAYSKNLFHLPYLMAKYPKFVDHQKVQGAPPVLQLPHLDNAQLLSDEEAAKQQLIDQGRDSDGAYQFGKAIAVESFDTESTLSKGRWIPLKVLKQQQQFSSSPEPPWSQNHDHEGGNYDDVIVWQLEIHSKSALSLNLIFSEFRLPSGTEFYVSGKKHILGAFTAEVNNKPDGVFATAPVAGDKLLLEYYTPKHLLMQKNMVPQIQLSHVVHGYKYTLLASSSDMTSKGFRQRDGSILSRYQMSRRIKEMDGVAGDIKRKGFKDQSSSLTIETMMKQAFKSSLINNINDDEEMPPIQAMSGKCNIDIACHLDEYYNQSRSVGVIVTDYNQKYCTGALINNVRQDGRQLFLTANHCAGFSNTSAHLVMFNHQKVHCGGGPEVVNEHDTATGLVKLGNYAPSDYILYEIVEHIPDAYDLYLAGWSALPEAPSARPRDHLSSAPLKSPWRNPRNHLRANHKGCIGDRRNDTVLGSRPMPTSTSEPGDPSLERLPIVGIHHPSGDSKKISFFFNGTLPKACWSECDLDDKKQYHWQIPKWSLGTTEPGSSGSPLFDANGRIVGQLHGGAASCFNRNGYDVYGAITDSFRTSPRIQDRLATYLDPDSTGRESMNGYSLASARHEAHKRQLR